MSASSELRKRPRAAPARARRRGAAPGGGATGITPPAGAPAPPGPEPVLDPTRRRLLRAAAELCHESGYEDLTASDLIEASGVVRSAFYAAYASKRGCVVAAHRLALAGLAARVEAARAPARDWEEGVGAALGALARDLGANPRLAHLVAVVGGALRLEDARLDPAPRLLAALDAPGAPPDDGAPAGASAAADARPAAVARAGVWELLVGEVRARHARRLRARLDELAFLALCPYLGPARALARGPTLAECARWAPSPRRHWTLFDSGVGELPRPAVERIAALRGAAGLRHRDLARALGVSTRTISRWLAGEGEPSPTVAARAVLALDALERVAEALPGRATREWLLAESPALGGGAPADALATGKRELLEAALSSAGLDVPPASGGRAGAHGR